MDLNMTLQRIINDLEAVAEKLHFAHQEGAGDEIRTILRDIGVCPKCRCTITFHANLYQCGCGHGKWRDYPPIIERLKNMKDQP